MNCIVTAGPTYEPLDRVRRLTNFSTGRLGTELANDLAAHGHHVTLLLSEQATWPGPRRAQRVETFTTTENLRQRLQSLMAEEVNALFHAAAVSDFVLGKIWAHSAEGEMIEMTAGKISTQHPRLLAELLPAPKIIAQLRDWFPDARIVGWKYEVDGHRADVMAQARKQIAANRTNACVANGPAYGEGFGLMTDQDKALHLPHPAALFTALRRLLL